MRDNYTPGWRVVIRCKYGEEAFGVVNLAKPAARVIEGGTYCVNNVSSTCDLDVEGIMG